LCILKGSCKYTSGGEDKKVDAENEQDEAHLDARPHEYMQLDMSRRAVITHCTKKRAERDSVKEREMKREGKNDLQLRGENGL
jgi:hypothetical protein